MGLKFLAHYVFQTSRNLRKTKWFNKNTCLKTQTNPLLSGLLTLRHGVWGIRRFFCQCSIPARFRNALSKLSPREGKTHMWWMAVSIHRRWSHIISPELTHKIDSKCHQTFSTFLKKCTQMKVIRNSNYIPQ